MRCALGSCCPFTATCTPSCSSALHERTRITK
jgi:hypothetical protein